MLAVAWRSFLRHYLALLVLCIAAGFAGGLLPVALGKAVPALSLRGHPLAREVVSISLAILVATPALILLSQSHRGQAVDFRSIAAESGRRAVAVVVCQAVVDTILVAPAFFVFPRLGSWETAADLVFSICELPVLAFNYIFLATLATESTNPLAAIGRTLQLLRGRWWRMCVVAFMLWLVSVAVIIAAQYSIAVFDWSRHWQGLVLGPLALGVRLLVVIPVAVAAYHLLRNGPSLPETAQIFD